MQWDRNAQVEKSKCMTNGLGEGIVKYRWREVYELKRLLWLLLIVSTHSSYACRSNKLYHKPLRERYLYMYVTAFSCLEGCHMRKIENWDYQVPSFSVLGYVGVWHVASSLLLSMSFLSALRLLSWQIQPKVYLVSNLILFFFFYPSGSVRFERLNYHH